MIYDFLKAFYMYTQHYIIIWAFEMFPIWVASNVNYRRECGT